MASRCRLPPAPADRPDRGDPMLVSAKVVTICAGGGGIPVVRDPSGTLQGVEAVIDKDRAPDCSPQTLLPTHSHADGRRCRLSRLGHTAATSRSTGATRRTRGASIPSRLYGPQGGGGLSVCQRARSGCWHWTAGRCPRDPRGQRRDTRQIRISALRNALSRTYLKWRPTRRVHARPELDLD